MEEWKDRKRNRGGRDESKDKVIWLDRWRVRGEIKGWMERRRRDIWYKRGLDAETNNLVRRSMMVRKMDEWIE